MCVAVPGKIIAIAEDRDDPVLGRIGTVDFQGSRIEVSLAMTPEVNVGHWVLVHAGFAITVLDEDDARETWEYLNLAGVVEMPTPPQTPGPPSADAAERDGDRG